MFRYLEPFRHDLTSVTYRRTDGQTGAGASLNEAPELQQLALNFLATFLVVVVSSSPSPSI